MRDQDARRRRPRRSGGQRREAGPRRRASSEEVGSSRMTSVTGVSVTVKARAISTIWRRAIERSPTMSPASMPWPGKISSSLPRISAPARRRQPKPCSAGVQDVRVLRHRQVRAERQFLEDAADAGLLRAGDADRRCVTSSPSTAMRAAVGRQRAGQHMHQRRLAGAVVADEAEAFARATGEIDARKRADGAETLFDAVQPDDRFIAPASSAGS